jgi:hypothetical protein
MQHPITPDLSALEHIGQVSHPLSLQPRNMRSVCETCLQPIVCQDWPRDPWRHAAPGELAELAGELAE